MFLLKSNHVQIFIQLSFFWTLKFFTIFLNFQFFYIGSQENLISFVKLFWKRKKISFAIAVIFRSSIQRVTKRREIILERKIQGEKVQSKMETRFRENLSFLYNELKLGNAFRPQKNSTEFGKF